MPGVFMRFSRRSSVRPPSGFSLIELLVAVTIIGVAVGLSLPKIAKVTNQTKVQRAAQALQQEIQQAYAIAGRNRAPVKLAWNSGTMKLSTTNMAGSTVYRSAALGSGTGYGFSSSEVAVSPTSLVIFPNGLAADTLVISVARDGYSRRLWVSKSGMMRLK